MFFKRISIILFKIGIILSNQLWVEIKTISMGKSYLWRTALTRMTSKFTRKTTDMLFKFIYKIQINRFHYCLHI